MSCDVGFGTIRSCYARRDDGAPPRHYHESPTPGNKTIEKIGIRICIPAWVERRTRYYKWAYIQCRIFGVSSIHWYGGKDMYTTDDDELKSEVTRATSSSQFPSRWPSGRQDLRRCAHFPVSPPCPHHGARPCPLSSLPRSSCALPATRECVARD
jgi:hypothetical protein